MRFVKYHVPILVLVIFLVLLASVYHSYPQQPPLALKILQDNACFVPCWDGLKIGDPEETVKTFYKERFTQYHDYTAGLKHLYSGTLKGQYSAYSSISNNRLEALYLISPLQFDFSIEKIIQLLGEPRYVRKSFGASFVTTDVYPFIVTYYPSEGYAFQFDLPTIHPRSSNQIEFCVEPTLLPSKVYIAKAGSLKDLSEAMNSFLSFQMDANQLKDYVNSLVAWSGYKCSTLNP